MKKLLYISVLFLSTLGIQSFRFANEPVIRLLPQSQLFIKGKSNIHSFTLDFSFRDYPQRLDMHCFHGSSPVHIIKSMMLKIPIEKFDCDNDLLKEDFLSTLKYKEFPEIAILIDHLVFSTTAPGSEWKELEAEIRMGGLERQQKIQYKMDYSGSGQVKMYGKALLNMQDYGIKPKPRFMGLIRVNELVEIDFLFTFAIHQ